MGEIPHSVILETINYFSYFLLSTFFMSCIKGLFVFTAVYIVTQSFKDLPSENKHILWFFTMCSFVLIPVITLFTPVDNLEIISLSKEKGVVYRVLIFLFSSKFTNLETTGIFAAPCTALSHRVLQTPHYKHYMPLLLFIIWITGAFICSLNIITGKIILSNFQREAQPANNKKIKTMIQKLSEDIGINCDVQVYKSRQCKLPFTCRIFRPVIIVPQDIERWPENRARVVLLHELAHIKHRDYLTKLISRTICSIYWFIPLTWIIHFKLCIEQEETCDSFVINSGEKPSDYASCIVDFARIKRKHVLLLGMFISRGGNTEMEKRILHLLSTSTRGSPPLFKHLWILPVICFILLSLFLTINPAVSGQYETLYGNWVNEEYNETPWHYAIQIYNPDGTFAVYENTYDTKPKLFGKFIVTDSWIDSEGNIWVFNDEYVGTYFQGKKVSQYRLNKISNSGNILEWTPRYSNTGEHTPVTEINLSNTFYRTLYRK
jgi:beta-lactamase regulating signal transducer with metallopeptidase domain